MRFDEHKAGAESGQAVGQRPVAQLQEAEAQLQDRERLLHVGAGHGVAVIGFKPFAPNGEPGAFAAQGPKL